MGDSGIDIHALFYRIIIVGKKGKECMEGRKGRANSLGFSSFFLKKGGH